MAQQIKFGDKLVLKGETLILDNGTSHGELKSKNGTIWIKGDLLVDGATSTINTEEINLADNNILINSNHTGVPTHDGGITINRGTSDNAIIQWNESTDKWEAKVGTIYATLKADTFEGNLTGNSTGMHFGALDTQGQDLISGGLSELNDVRIWFGSINDTTIGAFTPSTGVFTTLTATTINGPLTGTVSSIANHTTDDLTEGSANLYYTQARVDARYATLHSSADAGTLDGQDGTYYLNWTNTTNKPTTLAGYGITDGSSSYSDTDVASYLGGNLDTHILPDTNATYDIGSASYKIRDLYLSDNSLHIGANVLRTDSSKLLFNGEDVMDYANITSKPTTLAGYGITDGYTDSDADARTQLKIDGLVGGASAAFDTLVEIQNAMATDTELTSAISGLNHDALSGFEPDEHIDWGSAYAGTIHDTNIIWPANIVRDNSHQALHWSSALSISGNTITLTKGDTSTESIVVPGTDITGSVIPATDNTYDLGSTTHKYANIYGHSVEATFADLAERYASDAPYESGTVVVFGGEAEITLTSELKDVSVAGVISTNPALKLNADAGNSQTHPYVALRGRVPCMLIGPVSKGDLIVTADNEPGYAQSIGKNDAGRSVFAKSIETDLTEGKKLVEVVIL
jgi:hypothetical protein